MNLSVLLASIPSPSTGVLRLGPLALRAYGLCIALGALAAIRISRDRFARRGGDADMVGRICWWAVPAGLVGARIYHVATDWSSTYAHAAWFRPFEIWKGGLGIWGGVALGTAVGCFVARRLKQPVVVLMDCAAVGLPVAQAIGRFGNYFNQELFGRPTTLPWGLRIDAAHRPDGFEGFATFHPTFLYEALWCLAIAGVVVLAERRWRFRPGQVFALYVALYTLGRYYFETLRIDNATHVGGLRINEIVAPVVGLVAALAFVVLGRTGTGSPTPPDEPRAPTPGAADESVAA